MAALQCPINSLRTSTGDGYISLEAHLTKFSELGQIQMNIDIARLDDGESIEGTLRRYSAHGIKHVACKSIKQCLNY